MKFELSKIGVIGKAEINLDGLTIICGANGTGKTTIGKTLYSIISATNNLEQNSIFDKWHFLISFCRDILRDLNFSYLLRTNAKFEKDFPVCAQMMELRMLDPKEYSTSSFLDDFEEEIKKLDFSLIKDDHRFERFFSNKLFSSIKEESITKIEAIKKELSEDPELIKYATLRTLKELKKEFYNQIAPVAKPSETSQISFTSNKDSVYKLTLKNNQVIDQNGITLNLFSNCFFVDDANILDMLNDNNILLDRRDYETLDFAYNIQVTTHRDHLINALKKNVNTYEESRIVNDFNFALDSIKGIAADNLGFKNGLYSYGKNRIDVRNLATGSKLFIILKTLIENGSIDTNTLIVLDEPENHLHPEWQNVMAEFIVKLVKIQRGKFLITTHSPNFLLALQVKSLEYDLNTLVNFYFAEKNKTENSTRINDITKNIDEAHYSLNMPYVEMENLFEKLTKK